MLFRDVSDIADGDWQSAKAEIARLRALLAKVDETDESEKTAITNGNNNNNNNRSGKWSSRSNMDEEPSEEQSTLGPLPTSKPKGGHEAHRLENMKKLSSGGSINKGTSKTLSSVCYN